MILVDTSVWIDFFKGNETSEHIILRNLIESEQDIALTGIILTELLQGIGEDHQFQRLRNYFFEFDFFEPNGIKTYLKAAQIYRKCRKSGRTIRKTVDSLIAAICIEHALTLLHKDRDFDAIASCTNLKTLKN